VVSWYSDWDCVCACPIPTIVPIAVSPDGVSWRTVQGKVVGNWLDAGAAGYIATQGTDVEMSPDGISWVSSKVSGTASVSVDHLNSGVSFAGGFVVSSETYKGMTISSMCLSTPISFNPAVWFSADGKTWAQQVLPDAYTGLGQEIGVCRINDHLLLADQSTGSDWLHWTSTDGRSWKPVSTDLHCGNTQEPTVWGLKVLSGHYFYDAFDPYGNYTLEVLGPDLQFIAPHQTGDVPDWQDVWSNDGADALGPAGLIVSDANGNLWIGVPTTE
jgi:hypothetical protein